MSLRITITGVSKGGRSQAVETAVERLRAALPVDSSGITPGAPVRATVQVYGFAPAVNDGWFRRVLAGLPVQVRYSQEFAGGEVTNGELSIGAGEGGGGSVAETVQDFFGGLLGGLDPRNAASGVRRAAEAVLPDDPFGVEEASDSISTAVWVAAAVGAAVVLALLGFALWTWLSG